MIRLLLLLLLLLLLGGGGDILLALDQLRRMSPRASDCCRSTNPSITCRSDTFGARDCTRSRQ